MLHNLLTQAKKSFKALPDKMEVLGDRLIANFYVKTSDLEVEEFQTHSDSFLIPGEIISHKNSKGSIPTMFWCHGGPHDKSEHAFLTEVAKKLNINVVGFDYRGSKILDGHYKNIKAAEYDSQSLYYNDVDNDYGGGHMRDLQAVIEYVSSKNIFDNNKFIIGGHSFGGYMVAMALTSPEISDYFKLGIAWSGFYDLENYKYINCNLEGSPEERLRKQSPKLYADKINQKIIVLHGGQADETSLVSRQGAEEFVNTLRNNNKNVIPYFNNNANHTNLDFISSIKDIYNIEHQTLEQLMGLESSDTDSTLL